MIKYFINKKYYYSSLDIIKNAPLYLKGVRNGREMIKKQQIEHPDFIYARLNDDDKWLESNGKSIKLDKIMIRRQYIKNNEKLNTELNNVKELLPKLPELINLTKVEKFCSDNGEILEIETRGVRKCGEIYFNLKDVMNGFNIIDLQQTIIKKESKYEINKHFICFDRIDSVNNKEKNYYLTYVGILKVLFSSRSGNVSNFIKWATETLFIIHLGTDIQKKKLASNILGISVKEFSNSLIVNVNPNIASIYFITLGTGKDLRNGMNLDISILDDDIISIYGFTKDLQRRLGEHEKKYKSIEGARLLLKYYSFIDKAFLSKAEVDIKKHFNVTDAHLDYGTDKEMVCTDKKTMIYLESYFKTVGKSYEGDKSDIIIQFEKMDMKHKYDIAVLNGSINLLKCENKSLIERHAKDIALMKVDNLELQIKSLIK